MSEELLGELACAGGTEAGEVAALTRLAVAPKRVETPCGPDLLVLTDAAGGQRVVDMADYDTGPRPGRTRHIDVFDAGSFVAYLLTHGDPGDGRVVVDETRQLVRATLDATCGPSQPGWSAHTVSLAARPTPEWTAWTAVDRRWLTLPTFAEHVEDHLADFVVPEGADWLELAQSFHATSNAQFQQAHRLASGETAFQWVEETTAKAGRKGELAVPEAFTLGLKPFEGSHQFEVKARFRYRLRSGELTVSVVLDQPDLIARAAFREFTYEIVSGLEANSDAAWLILNGPLS